MASKHFQAKSLVSQGIFDDLESFREFEQRVTNLSDQNTKVQGDAFEIFVEAYLATQPLLQCDETWLVGDIPVDVRERLNLPSDTKGIDGVYRTAVDKLVPYQVKFRSNRPHLGFNDVASFLGITEKADDRLLITNCDSIAIDVQNRTGIRSVRGVDFDRLTKNDLDLIESWLKKVPKKRDSIQPDPYQIEALENISNHLSHHDRGSVVMACGTGKTLVALWAVERINAKRILVLVPSLTLLQQTLEDWSVHNSWGKRFSYLCVCSDPHVDLKDDEIEIDPSDVLFRIDTDPELVRGFLGQDNGKVKVVFSTYQSSQVVSQATKDNFYFDIAIFDEAHKTTGSAAGRFALALHDENIRIKKRLFLTATPKHYDIKKKDKDGEFKVVSMDDESVYGSRAHTLLFSDAVSKGIICPYKVVITFIDKQRVDDFALKNGITLVEGDVVKSKWVAGQIAVSSAIKHTGASKIITFHSRVRSAREFASDEAHGVKKFIEDFEVFHVHGKQKSNERKDTITKFRHAHKSLITNAKCLTEGVDVPAVDMVAFVDPKHSKIDIAQAVGRAMRKPRGGEKQVGYILVPIFAEDSSSDSIEEAIKGEAFDDVALILNSLLEQDNELVDIIRELKEAKGRGEVFNISRLKQRVEFIGPSVSLDTLSGSMYTEIVNRLGSNWDEWFGALKRFWLQNGHCRLPADSIQDGFNLGKWVSHQRHLKSSLSANKICKLNSIDFVWDALEDKWVRGFNALESFYLREHHLDVPKNFVEDGLNISNFIVVQKRKRNKNTLSADQIRLLDKINFPWSPIQEKWTAAIKALIKFRDREGHSDVPTFHIEDDFHLGEWVSVRRRLKKKNKLSSAQITQLNELGFVWDSFDLKWESGFRALLKFKRREGHTNVPPGHIEDNVKLYSWTISQRTMQDKLTQDRLRRLHEINFVWDVRQHQWDVGFAALSKFNIREGHCDVPTFHIEGDFKLGYWVAHQRHKSESLSKENLKKLNDLGFTWDISEKKWEIVFGSLQKFVQREGHCNVPPSHIEDSVRLGAWIKMQRSAKNKLSVEKLSLLDQLGFKW